MLKKKKENMKQVKKIAQHVDDGTNLIVVESLLSIKLY